ncbi:MAG: hypothetical protein AAFR04_06360 [Pseudomonadota bacterium]
MAGSHALPMHEDRLFATPAAHTQPGARERPAGASAALTVEAPVIQACNRAHYLAEREGAATVTPAHLHRALTAGVGGAARADFAPLIAAASAQRHAGTPKTSDPALQPATSSDLHALLAFAVARATAHRRHAATLDDVAVALAGLHPMYKSRASHR